MFCVGTTVVKFTSYPAVSLGKISYSIYVIHPLIASLVYGAGYRAADLSISPVLYELIVIAIMIVASWATYELIERPCVRLGRTFMHPTQMLQPNPPL
jgi:peptidoglycan/LPS O-acetylase OafA/YrhL